MLVEVFLSRETFAGVPFAVWMGAVYSIFGTPMLVMNLALMSQQASGVCEAWKVLASRGGTSVGSLVLIHVFALRR